jgi:hypothetical protein
LEVNSTTLFVLGTNKTTGAPRHTSLTTFVMLLSITTTTTTTTQIQIQRFRSKTGGGGGRNGNDDETTLITSTISSTMNIANKRILLRKANILSDRLDSIATSGDQEHSKVILKAARSKLERLIATLEEQDGIR